MDYGPKQKLPVQSHAETSLKTVLGREGQFFSSEKMTNDFWNFRGSFIKFAVDLCEEGPSFNVPYAYKFVKNHWINFPKRSKHRSPINPSFQVPIKIKKRLFIIENRKLIYLKCLNLRKVITYSHLHSIL